MGQPMKRSFWFEPSSSFKEAFPELDQALIEYRETGDGVFENRHYSDPSSYTKPHQVEEPLMRCSNPRCVDGGYEIDREIQKMVLSKKLADEFVLCCHGNEGSPKGRRKGAECCNMLHVRLAIKYRMS